MAPDEIGDELAELFRRWILESQGNQEALA